MHHIPAKDNRLVIITAFVTIMSIESAVVVVAIIVVAIYFWNAIVFFYARTRAPLLKMAFWCSGGNKFLKALETSKFSINIANRNGSPNPHRFILPTIHRFCLLCDNHFPLT